MRLFYGTDCDEVKQLVTKSRSGTRLAGICSAQHEDDLWHGLLVRRREG
jgi:hypothetical protein